MNYYYIQEPGGYVISVGVQYGKPEVHPPVLRNFTKLESFKALDHLLGSRILRW
jgi:hypothetical protein